MMSQNQLITHGTTTTVGNIHLTKAKPWRQETSRTAHAQTRLSVREKGGKLSLGVFMIPLRKKNSLYYYISTISDTIQYLLEKLCRPRAYETACASAPPRGNVVFKESAASTAAAILPSGKRKLRRATPTKRENTPLWAVL